MNNEIILIPTREQVEGLQAGDLALDCFGRMSRVVRIAYRGVDVNGRHFVGFYTELGEHSSISNDYKEGELVVTLPLATKYTADELDRIERAAHRQVSCGCCEGGCVCTHHADIPRGVHAKTCGYHKKHPHTGVTEPKDMRAAELLRRQ